MKFERGRGATSTDKAEDDNEDERKNKTEGYCRRTSENRAQTSAGNR